MVSKTKRLIFVSALVFSIMTAGAYGAKLTYAQDTTVHSTLVQKIADKFGLKTTDVQAVFDQQRQERIAQMEAKYEKVLTDAVSKGELTENKKQLILKKHKEIEANRKAQMTAMQSMTPEQRKAAMQKAKTDIETWAKANGVDVKYLLGKGAKGMMFGHRGKK